MKQFSLIVLFALFAFTGWAANSNLKPRLVVCTDIAPADVEPDDMESMVRLMTYADCFEIEALITSVGWNCDPYPKEWAEYLTRVIEAYRKDVPNLMRRSGQSEFLPLNEENGQQELGYWPSADYIKSRAVMGSEHGGIKVIGERNDSPGSELLIRLADEDDPRPIYVAAWGGANTLAQAIWRVKQMRSDDEVKNFVHKFRLTRTNAVGRAITSAVSVPTHLPLLGLPGRSPYAVSASPTNGASILTSSTTSAPVCNGLPRAAAILILILYCPMTR